MKKTSVSLDSNTPIPEFSLPAVDSAKPIGTADFRQQSNLVLYFFPGPSCEHCREVLITLKKDGELFDWLEASVLAIASSPLAELGAAVEPEIFVLADEDGKVTAEFRGDGQSATEPFVVIADRFGAFFSRMELRDDEDPDLKEIESTLLFIATQCPECGRPDRDVFS